MIFWAAKDDNLTPFCSEVDEGDPGIIIILEDDDAIHRCLQLLPGIPPLNVGYPVSDPVAGRQKMFIFIAWHVAIYAGTNAAASRAAFTTWLDAVMLHICPNCIVQDVRNNRQEGWFQMLKLDQFISATSFMSGLDHWANACRTAVPPASAGKLYHIAGAGKGSLTMKHHFAGPFQTWPHQIL